MEEIRLQNNQGSPMSVVIVVVLVGAVALNFYKHWDEHKLNKYQIAAASAQEETMDSMESGSIMMTDQGFSKMMT